MKFEHYKDYSSENTEKSEAVLLTVWAILKQFEEDLVLVGGLVPRYLCNNFETDFQPATIDVDLGVSLGLSSGLYDTTKTRLQKAGFIWKNNRFVKSVKGTEIFLDFLTEKNSLSDSDSVMVDDIPVSAFFGINRALTHNRTLEISGHDLYGAKVVERVRVCEVGPYACLKLQAYHSRAKSKDVFDLIHVIRDYKQGHEIAASLFNEEAGKNPAYEIAREILAERFVSADSKGPVQYADFCLGGQSFPDINFRRQQLSNEAVDIAKLLLK